LAAAHLSSNFGGENKSVQAIS